MHSKDKDQLLSKLLKDLDVHGIARLWAKSSTPYSDLATECSSLIGSEELKNDFGEYLRSNPIIQDTLRTLLSHLAMAANSDWKEVPHPAKLIARHGWMIGRWLPTFLIIDGPLGRFLRDKESPLSALLKAEYANYPTLAQARDLFNHDLFRRVRNGVGHWSFTIENESAERLICYDWKSGVRAAEVSIIEAEALHYASAATIECFDVELFRHANPE